MAPARGKVVEPWVGSTEVLLDDSLRLADRMRSAQVDVTLRIWLDMPHVFQGLALFLPEAREAIAEAGQFLETRTTSSPHTAAFQAGLKA